MLISFFIVHDSQIRQPIRKPIRKGADKVQHGRVESLVFLDTQHHSRAAFILKFQLGPTLDTALLVTTHRALVLLRIHQEIPLEALFHHRVSLIITLITSS